MRRDIFKYSNCIYNMFQLTRLREARLIFRNCKRLCWELDNAIAGEEKEKKKIDQRMAIQTLLMLLASRPSWRDTTSEDTYGGTLNYPEADIP